MIKQPFSLDLLSVSSYYPFGMLQPLRHWEKPNYTHRFGYNGMEKDDEVKGLGTSYDYGARFLDPRLGRWLSRDPLESKYASLSPFNFAGNTPIQAKDPDGKVILFINGQHNGTGGQASYWGGYDAAAIKIIGDKSVRYIDGAIGGWSNTIAAFFNLITQDNLQYKDRIAAGLKQGEIDAASIIENLSDGESIKVITHSMGTAFGRGYVTAITKWASDHKKKVNFEFEVDINAFQGTSLFPIRNLKTFNKTGGKDGGKFEDMYNWIYKNGPVSLPFVAPIPNSKDLTTKKEKNLGHEIMYMDSYNLPESTQNSQKVIKIEEGTNNGNK